MYCHDTVGTTDFVFTERSNVLCPLFGVSFKRVSTVLNSITEHVEQLPGLIKSDDHIRLKLKSSFFGLLKDLFICLPPEESTHLASRENL